MVIQKKSCLSCNNFIHCDYSHKSSNYRCEDWKPLQTVKGFDFDLRGNGTKQQSSITQVLEKKTASNKEMNLISLLDEILDPNAPLPPDLKIDDRDLKEAPNVYEFVYNKRWGYDGMGVFSRQLYAAMKLYGEYCPRCSDKKFVSSIEHCPYDMKAEDMPDKVVFLRYGKCPKCKVTRQELYLKKELTYHNELAGLAGQRGGKSAMVSGLLTPYHTHKYLKISNPARLFTQLPNYTLIGTFVALTYVGAYELLWSPFYSTIKDVSKWFKEYHSLLDFYSNRYGEEIYKFPDSFLHYKHRSMLISPASPDKRTLRGRTRMFSVIDELGWFDASQGADNKVKISAEQIYIALDRSLKTVRQSAKHLIMVQGYNTIIPAYAYNVSSPSSINDKISTLVESNRHNDGEVYTFQLATWELNPAYQQDSFSKEFADNPTDAARDFGAVPPISGNPFFTETENLASVFNGKPNRIDYSYVYRSSKKSGRRYCAAKATFIPSPDIPPSILAIDAGYSRNSFGMAIGHYSNKDKKCIVDGLMEIAPRVGENVLHYPTIFNTLVVEAIKAFNVKVVLADRWNSLMLLQQLEENNKDLYCSQYSVKYEDFLQFRSAVYDTKDIELPKLQSKPESIRTNTKDYPHAFKYQPVDHLLFQMITVEDARKTVIKGHGWTDDIFRALVLMHSHLNDKEFREEHLIGKALTNTMGSKRALVAGSSIGASSASNSQKQTRTIVSNTGSGSGTVFGRS